MSLKKDGTYVLSNHIFHFRKQGLSRLSGVCQNAIPYLKSPHEYWAYHFMDLSVGNCSTSLMLNLCVISINRLSMPYPITPICGNFLFYPYASFQNRDGIVLILLMQSFKTESASLPHNVT